MSSEVWRTLKGVVVDDFLSEVVEATTNNDTVVHVGCDSQKNGEFTDFVSVIVLLRPFKGGRVLWTRERVKRIDSLRTRLLREVELSVNVSFRLSEVLGDDVELNVHIDANTDLKYKSAKFMKELVGYAQGCGFNTLTKPDSWAAMNVADHIVKFKHKRSTHVSHGTR